PARSRSRWRGDGLSGQRTPSRRSVASGVCAVDPAALALKNGARLDRQSLVHDVANDLGRLRQNHRLALDLSVDRTADPNVVARDAPAHVRTLADRDRAALDVALYLAIDLNVAIAHQIALDLQTTADDRVRPVAGAPSRSVGCHRRRIGCAR